MSRRIRPGRPSGAISRGRARALGMFSDRLFDHLVYTSAFRLVLGVLPDGRNGVPLIPAPSP
jgi:hypothetical protein